MDHIKNFRELAYQVKNSEGKTIKKQMIFRSGEPTFASDSDISKLKSLRIKNIYDLRSLKERESHLKNPSFTIKGFDVADSKASSKMDNAYLESISENPYVHVDKVYQDILPFSPMVKALIKDMIHDREPFLFHCAAGKDRTGVVGAIIMSILGFSEDEMVLEYIKLDERVTYDAEEAFRKQGLAEEVIQKLKPLNTVDANFIKSFIHVIKEKYQTLENYLINFIELTPEDIKSFKEYYLE